MEEEKCSTPCTCEMTTSDIKYSFTCGACGKTFQTICQLHLHLGSHGFGGSYYYSQQTRTAYPKFDSVCDATQTDSGEIDSVSEVNNLDEDPTEIEDTFEAKFFDNDGHFTFDVTDRECLFDEVMHQSSADAAIDSIKDSLKAIDDSMEMKDNPQMCQLNLDDRIANKHTLKEDDRMFRMNQKKKIKLIPVNFLRKDTLKKSPFKGKFYSGNQTVVKKPSRKRKTDSVCSAIPSYTLGSSNTKSDLKLTSEISIDIKSVCEDIFTDRFEITRTPHEEEDKIPHKVEDMNDDIKTENKKKKSDNPTHVTCPKCNKSVAQGDIDLHLCHEIKQRWKCVICSSVLASRCAFKTHIKKHKGIKDYQCDKCGRLFTDQANMIKHCRLCGIPKEKRRTFVCSDCGAFLISKDSLRNHKRLVHTYRESVVCEICGKSYKDIKNHRLRHVPRARLKCDICSKTFSEAKCLAKHKKLHKADPKYQCTFCGKLFHENWNMKAHMRQHTNEKPYTCSICGERFTHNVSRKAHMAKH